MARGKVRGKRSGKKGGGAGRKEGKKNFDKRYPEDTGINERERQMLLGGATVFNTPQFGTVHFTVEDWEQLQLEGALENPVLLYDACKELRVIRYILPYCTKECQAKFIAALERAFEKLGAEWGTEARLMANGLLAAATEDPLPVRTRKALQATGKKTIHQIARNAKAAIRDAKELPHLPEGVVEHILRLSDPRTAAIGASVCKSWREAARRVTGRGLDARGFSRKKVLRRLAHLENAGGDDSCSSSSELVETDEEFTDEELTDDEFEYTRVRKARKGKSDFGRVTSGWGNRLHDYLGRHVGWHPRAKRGGGDCTFFDARMIGKRFDRENDDRDTILVTDTAVGTIYNFLCLKYYDLMDARRGVYAPWEMNSDEDEEEMDDVGGTWWGDGEAYEAFEDDDGPPGFRFVNDVDDLWLGEDFVDVD